MYQITRDYIKLGNSRSGQPINRVKFIVSHDTANPGSTAYNNQSYFNNSQPSASAHTFIDDKYILEIIPLTEKAWHVQYNKPTDNRLFGEDANDAAIGVELCWGGNINFDEAYKRYVWYHAYLCEKFNLDPKRHIVSHKTLDPQRRSDPENALSRYGITWTQFIEDVSKVFNGEPEKDGVYWDGMEMKPGQIGRIRVLKRINLWKRVDVCNVEECAYCRNKKPELKFERILNPGETYRVYSYDGLYGGQYGVGAGYYVTNMEGYIKYETPSKAKLKELEEFNKEVK